MHCKIAKLAETILKEGGCLLKGPDIEVHEEIPGQWVVVPVRHCCGGRGYHGAVRILDRGGGEGVLVSLEVGVPEVADRGLVTHQGVDEDVVVC